MKTAFHPSVFIRLSLVSAFLAFLPFNLVAQAGHPVIRSIVPKGTDVLVSVDVPANVLRITLESRARIGTGSWTPVAVVRTGGGAQTLNFTLPASQRLELLRVRADYSEPLPGSFYAGTNKFWGGATNNSDLTGGLYTSATDANGGVAPKTDARQVTESDIWKFNGSTLYFFNQYRGLQVIDVSKPDSPSLRSTLSLPAAGEQMYLAGPQHVVLLAREWCASADQSEVIVVSVASDPPQVVSKLPVPGYIQESRMVGSALYVVSQTSKQVAGSSGTTWEWGSQVSSFDLTDPSKPVARGVLWQSGYGNVIAATDTYLFVATQDTADWWRSTINVIDITAPDGTMAPHGSIRPAGRIPDKFKIDYSGTVLTTISEDSRSGTSIVTRLETFRLPDPRSGSPVGIVKLGEVQLGAGERLHATRFQGNRVYVVTFFRTDPLWVVDLADPIKPHIAGSLEIPGWSTYIEPLGDRLVSVGVETNRVAVSLFDVADASKPSMLSRVLLGSNYSWTEANYDEKALTVLQDAKLILVPYSGDTKDGWTSRVQLIDLNDTSLVLRGVIEHEFQPRRTAFLDNRILSLSGNQLLSVDATDRDAPVVRGSLTLASPVERLFLYGDYLLEISSAVSWSGSGEASMLRLASAADPNRVLAELSLGPETVAGAGVHNTLLHILQADAGLVVTDAGGDQKGTNFLHTTIDLSKLPSLSIAGQAGTNLTMNSWYSRWQPVWPKDDVVVWVGGGSRYYYWGGPLIGGLWRDGFYPWPIASGGGHFVAMDLSKPEAPVIASEIDLTDTSRWGFSEAFASGTRVYTTYAVSEPNPADPKSSWVQRQYLQVIDFDDPFAPTLRKPINVPGSLRGLSHNGEMLYTVGQHWSDTQVGGGEWLDGSAYDGVAAHLVGSMQLPDAWPRPLLVQGDNVFLGVASYPKTGTDSPAHQLQSWKMDETGKFAMLTSFGLKNPASTVIVRSGLLALQDTYSDILLFDATDPAKLVPLTQDQRPNCVWFDLNQADGNLTQGLWVPLGAYGVEHIKLGP